MKSCVTVEGYPSIVAMMDYSYLNQGGFDPNCSLPGMDTGLSSCNLPGGPYGDLGRCAAAGGPVSQAYGYNNMRPFQSGPPAISNSSCSMMPRPREHPQHAMFPAGEYRCEYSICVRVHTGNGSIRKSYIIKW